MNSIISKEISAILVRGTNWVGDAVMTLPALKRLRHAFPKAKLTILTPERNADVFRGQAMVDEVVPFDPAGSAYRRARRQANLLRGREFDVGLILPNSFESALALAMAKIPVRIGYATDFRSPLLSHALHVPDWKSHRHEAYYYLALTDALAAPAVENPLSEIVLTPDSAAIEAGKTLLNRFGIEKTGRLIAIGPGSTNSAAKRWPAEYFARLCTLINRFDDLSVVALGSPGDAEVATAVTAGTDATVINLAGKTTLMEAIGILSFSSIFISNDMGLAHLSGAMGIRTAVIFGPTDDVTTRPLGPSVKIIREPVECSPCMLRICPIDHRCMTRVSPERVFEEIREWLA